MLWRLRAGALALGVLFAGQASAGVVEVFHAISLAGPMHQLKKAFEARHKDISIVLVSGVSKEFADRIQKGEPCDVFAPSSPAVMDDLMKSKVAGSGQDAVSWYVVFSANELVVITGKGNPSGIRQIADLAKPGVKFVRVTGEKDLVTGRTIEFLKRAAALEGKPEVAQTIIDAAVADPAKPTSLPDVVGAVRKGKADAGVVYYSVAVDARDHVGIVRFPASVNLSDSIRNAASVPATAKNPNEGIDFIRFILSADGQKILTETGQPPVVPPVGNGAVPAELKH